MASGALPPGFPAVEIDGEHYWDGGIVSNTPLSYVWDEKPLTTALIVQVDLFKPIGELPTNIDEVLERHKDIQYASKQRFNVDHVKQIGELRGALIRLIDKLPPRLRNDPDAKRLASLCDGREWAGGPPRQPAPGARVADEGLRVLARDGRRALGRRPRGRAPR